MRFIVIISLSNKIITMPNVSVVIPVYNEEKGGAKGINRVKNALQNISGESEIIAVNDGSTDKTEEVLKDFGYLKIINHNNNRGYGAAIKTGIKSAKYENILIIDADNTYPADKIPEILSHTEDHDMVVGARTGKSVHHSILKRIAKWPIHLLANYLTDYKIPDLNSGLRVFKKDLALKYFRLLPNGFSLTSNITLAFLSDGYRVKYIPIDYYKRAGKSKVRPFADAINYLTLVLRMILFYNPLKIFIPLSGIFFLASIASLAYDIFVIDNVGDKSIMLFIGFVQVAILGLLADLINKRGSE